MIKNILFACILAFSNTLVAQHDNLPPLAIDELFAPSPDHTPGCEYYFLSPHDGFNLVDPDFRSVLIIADRFGEMLFFKGLPGNSQLFSNFVFDFKLQPNGQMSFHNQNAPNTKHYVLDSTLKIVDSVDVPSPYFSDSHELLLTEDGHKYVMGYDYRIMNLDTLTEQGGLPMSTQANVEGNVIFILDSTNNVVFQWNGFDYFDIGDMDYTNLTDTLFVDFMHANSISLDPAGNLIVSIRNFNEVVKINRQTGAIMWRLGGKNSDFTFVDDTLAFSLQHHATVLPNGNITILDNGTYHNPPVARAIEYQIDETNNTATLVWEYRYIRETISVGSMQVLPNGNRLINWGADIDASVYSTPIVEVTENYQEVLNIDLPPGFFSYRALCYDLPWEPTRPQINCHYNNGVTTLSVDSGFQAYYWLQTDDTTSTITVSNTGTYQVFGYNGYGWVGSKGKHIANLQNPCDTVVGLAQLVNTQTKLYPNPSNGYLQLELPQGVDLATVNVTIANSLGQMVETQNHIANQGFTITHNLPPGTYFIKAQNHEISWQGKFIVW